MHTFLDFDFLKTLPEAQVRNGFAELIKISSCAHLRTFDLLDELCERLIQTRFGRIRDECGEVKKAADEINRAGIFEMLKLETPNLHEIGLDRVIAYGHTWSPLHEVRSLVLPDNCQTDVSQLSPVVPLRHGHAISIDMAFSATLANTRGLLSSDEHRRLLNLFSRAGLSMDHELFNEDMLERATKAILKTRDGLLRAAVPSPLGSCRFLNDVSTKEMNSALRHHKMIVQQYPRKGAGIDAYVDSSDTGYSVSNISIEKTIKAVDGELEMKSSGDSNGIINSLREVLPLFDNLE
jgi:3-dehydroquinate synthase